MAAIRDPMQVNIDGQQVSTGPCMLEGVQSLKALLSFQVVIWAQVSECMHVVCRGMAMGGVSRFFLEGFFSTLRITVRHVFIPAYLLLQPILKLQSPLVRLITSRYEAEKILRQLSVCRAHVFPVCCISSCIQPNASSHLTHAHVAVKLYQHCGDTLLRNNIDIPRHKLLNQSPLMQ